MSSTTVAPGGAVGGDVAMGGGPRARRGVTAAELVAVVASDHASPGTRARARNLLMSRALDPVERRLLTDLVASPGRRSVPVAQRVSPIGAAHVPGKEQRSRDLTAGEAAWVAGLPSDPAALSADDLKTLSQLSQTVRNRTEGAIIEAKLGPAREREARLDRVRDLERRLAASDDAPSFTFATQAWEPWRRAIGARIHAETPELTEVEAYGRGTRLVEEAQAAKRQESTRNFDMAELGGLLRETGTTSAVFPTAHTWGIPGRADAWTPPAAPEPAT